MKSTNQCQSKTGTFTFARAVTAAALVAILAGCGGGGGGGGGGTGGGTNTTLTLTGKVSTTSTSTPANTALAQRAVTVQGQPSLTAATNSSGTYTLAGVPAGTAIVLVVNDSTCGGAQVATKSVTTGSGPSQTVDIPVQYNALTQPPPAPCF